MGVGGIGFSLLLRISKRPANCFSFVIISPPSLSVPPAACPVLCSGNGQYDKGSCVCYSGWKGPECDVPVTQCIDPLCGGHGTCTDGNCVCSIGYKGQNCAEGERSRVNGVVILRDVSAVFTCPYLWGFDEF